MSALSPIALARFCGLYSGVVFGIYWIPLRTLETAGLPGLWSTTVFNLASFIVTIPILVVMRRRFIPGRLRFHVISLGSGLGYVLYSSAFLFTDVISVIVLFYLMPVWGFVLARLFLGERITAVRWVSMLIAVIGLWLILGKDSGVPIPTNVGDWMALVSGLLWAAVALMLLTDDGQESAFTYGAGFIMWGLVIAVLSATVLTQMGLHPPAQLTSIDRVAAWLLPFALIVIVPAAIATVYAPTKLNPGVVGLLFMTEISVGTITAAIWADEPFGLTQIMGVVMITIAGALEPITEILGKLGRATRKCSSA